MIYLAIAATITLIIVLIYAARAFIWPWYVEFARLQDERATGAAQREVMHLDAKTRHVEAYKIRSGNGDYMRESLVIPELGIIPAPLGHAPRESIASSYAPKIQITHAPAPALQQLAAPTAPTVHIANPPFNAKLFDTIPFNSLQTLLGIRTDTGNLDIVNIARTSHKLIVARSGMGKSTAGLSDLLCAMYRNDAERLRVVMLDPEGLTLAFKPYCVKYAQSKDEIFNALKWLNAQVATTVKDIANKKLRLNALPSYTLVYLEESLAFVQTMTAQERQIYLELLCAFAVTARKAGYFLHMASQRPAASNQQLAAIRDQFSLRMAGAAKKAFLIDSLEFDDDATLETICTDKKPGQFVREIEGKNVIIKTPFLDLDTLDEIVPSLLRHRELDQPSNSTDFFEQPIQVFDRYSLRLVKSEESAQDDQPTPTITQETKEDATKRLWKEGYQSVRSLGAELAKLGYSGTSVQPMSEFINRLGLTKSSDEDRFSIAD